MPKIFQTSSVLSHVERTLLFKFIRAYDNGFFRRHSFELKTAEGGSLVQLTELLEIIKGEKDEPTSFVADEMLLSVAASITKLRSYSRANGRLYRGDNQAYQKVKEIMTDLAALVDDMSAHDVETKTLSHSLSASF